MFPVNAGTPELPAGEEVHAVDYSQFNRRVAVGTTQGSVYIYDNSSKQLSLLHSIEPRDSTPAFVKWAPSGDVLLTYNQTGYLDLWHKKNPATSMGHGTAPCFQLSWSTYGVSCPVTCARFITAPPSPTEGLVPQPTQQQPMRGGYGHQARVKPSSLSFVYGSVDGSITTVFVDMLTGQWASKVHNGVHNLGVTALVIHPDQDAYSNTIMTGGADGYFRVNSITYDGELQRDWIDSRVSWYPIVDLAIHSSSNHVSVLDRTGSITLLKATDGVYKSYAQVKSDTEDTRVRQLIWIPERQILCAVANGGDVRCLVDHGSNQWTQKPINEVLGI